MDEQPTVGPPTTPQAEKNKRTNMKILKWGCLPIVGIIIVFAIIGKIMQPSEEERKAAETAKLEERRIADSTADARQAAERARKQAEWEALPQKTRDSILTANRRDSLQRIKEAEQQRKEAAAAAEQSEKESNPLKYLKVKKWTWEKGGFGSVALVNITFVNEGVKTAKDIQFRVDFSGESGTTISSQSGVATVSVPPGKSKSTGEINLGFIDGQTAGASIEILDARFE